ncbi:MAG: hypothetical protein IAE89_04730 [Anaerolineae bacterium]|nr:hypothetical protein [Anaerolineae bacterium]
MAAANHSTHRAFKAGLFVLIATVAMTLVLLGQFNAVPVNAQAAPTFTPADQLTRAYEAVRSALEQRFNATLRPVASYTWEQMEFVNGIDDCTTNVEAPRPLYYGWRFVLTGFDGLQYEGRSSFDGTIITTCDEVTAGTVAAASPDSSLPPPVAGSAMVGGFELGGHALELNSNTVSLMQRSGMTWVKMQHEFRLGEDPGVVASIINNAHAQGFKVLVGIPGEPAEMGDFNSYISSYANFVAGVAALGADAIEVWNEPNIDREWPVGSINGASYTQLLAAAFNAIKGRSPSTLVISGAPAPTGFFGAAGCTANGCNDDVFMQQMAAAGAAQYMDCVGLHYNEGIVSPTATGGDSRGSYPSYFFSSMLNRGYAPFGGVPVCFTELGFLSPQGFNEPLPGAFAWAQNTTVAQQAQWLAEAAVASANSGRVRIMIVWNVDFPFWGTDPAGGFAMFRPDRSCPACDSLGAVMR